MNKKHGITISLTGELPDGMLTDDMAEGSYNNVASKLTKIDKLKLEQQ
jgi:predicted DNA-binding protein (MmcQ/YjbR family)|tara:strand:- start:197 stop:340 length:144 start_codon:yes stop_codon:yes gene_type:complete